MLAGDVNWLARPQASGNFTPGEAAVVPRPLPAWRPVPALLYRFVFATTGRLLGDATPLLLSVSLGLHILSTVALFSVMLKLVQDKRAAILASVIYVMHPLHTDVVSTL